MDTVEYWLVSETQMCVLLWCSGWCLGLLCFNFGIVVSVWDSYVGYCGVVNSFWDFYVGYCGGGWCLRLLCGLLCCSGW